MGLRGTTALPEGWPISDPGNGNESIHRRIGMNPSFLIYPSAFALRMARFRQSILQKEFTGGLVS
jgi:hypothetical protein